MRKKIVHAEPNDSLREKVREDLKGTKYEVVKEAKTAKEALAALDSVRPDLLVISLAIPIEPETVQGNVLDLLALILSRPTPPKIVVCHAIGTWNLGAKAMRAGAAGVMTKNTSREDFLELLRKAEDFLAGTDPARRKRVRLKAHLAGWYKKPEDSFFKRMQPATVVDISGEGVGVSTIEKIPRNSSLKMNIRLPDSNRPIKTSAEVMWSRFSAKDNQHHIGLRFTRLSDRDKTRLEQYILDRIATD